MTKLQNTQENTLTKKTIIPLMEKLGFLKVEFNGGVQEEGKDIICWEEDRLKNTRVIVAQVKHFKFTNSQSDQYSLNNVINQLTQCFIKPIPFTDKKYYTPYESYLISTFPIDTQTLKTRFSENPTLIDRKIEIIDGYKLSELIIQHLPDQASEYLEEAIEVKLIAEKDFNNKTVLKALGFQEQLHLKNIYTDIDFSLGKTTTRLFFSNQYNPSIKRFEIDKDSWKRFKEIIVSTEKTFGTSYITQSLNDIEINFEQEIEQSKEWEKHKKSIQLDITSLEGESKRITSVLKTFIAKKIELEIRNKETKDDTQLILIKKELMDVDRKLKPLEIIEHNLARAKSDLKAHQLKKTNPKYKFAIDGKKLYNILENKKEIIEKDVRDINKSKEAIRDIRSYLEKWNEIFESANQILNNSHIIQSLFNSTDPKVRTNFSGTILKLPLDVVFNSGLNITLLGEAGAGKTTSLQIYAHQLKDNKDKLVIWAPLPKVLRGWSENRPEISDLTKIQLFESSLLEYLNFNGVKISEQRFIEILNKENIILLFDSVDEAIRYNEWLPNGISELAKKYSNNIQIIVTSRLQGKYLDDIPFFTITLMPFTKTQRNTFIKKWFSSDNEKEISVILNHLRENKQIDEITRTPLLTTALCVLAKNGLTLPQTELKLYNDRIKLLTGYYDSVKQIQTRISTSPQDLEVLSRKLAFLLHSKGKRESDLNYLLSEAKHLMTGTLNEQQAKVALEELIDPCNVLVPMNDSGEFGFGHLRFQEHLAAMELNSNRSINILPFLKQGWWHDSLILFSQMCDNLSWLINLIGHEIIQYPSNGIISEMIKNRSDTEQNEIKGIIKKYKDDINEFTDETFF